MCMQGNLCDMITVEEAFVTCVSRTAARYVSRTWDNEQ